MHLSELQRVVRELRMLAWASAGMLVVLAIVMLVAMVQKDRLIEKMTLERPIAVVPGAVAGEYIAGLSDANLTLAARYLVGLPTNVTPANIDDRLAELLAHSTPEFLPTLTLAGENMRAEVKGQAQSRVLIVDPKRETLRREGDEFTYRVEGSRKLFAGGLVMREDQGSATLRFRLGSPSERNRFGIWLTSLSISSVDARKPTTGSPQ
jgi:hypothetical protein